MTASAADWPHFRGPDSNGIAPDKGINKDWKAKPPKQLWSVDMGDNGFAGPIVAAGKVFIIDHAGGDDVVRAIDLASGKEAWKFTYADPGRDNYGFAHSSPAFDNGKLYTLSRTGHLHCIDAAKGAKLWDSNLRVDYQGQTGNWEYAASPIVDGNKLIVCPGGKNGVVALDKESGKEIWTGGGPDPAGYATPVIANISGKKQYIVFEGKALIGVDPDKGGPPIWRCPWPTKYEVNAASPIIVDDSSIFVTSGYDYGCGLIKVEGAQAKPLWKNTDLEAHFNTPVLINGFIYGIGDHIGLVCLEAKTGAAKWKQGLSEKGGIAAVDGILLAVNGQSGEVVMIEASPDAYKELGKYTPLGGQSWTAPVIADGKLIIRNTKKLACYDLK
jgi:outer membrane protein assembly factor BamB